MNHSDGSFDFIGNAAAKWTITYRSQQKGKDDSGYTIIRRAIKYPRIEFKTGKPVIILPDGYQAMDEFISRHSKWITRKQEFIANTEKKVDAKRVVLHRTEASLEKLVREAVKRACEILNVKLGRVVFRKMTSKWASCSRDGNLTLNKLFIHLPKAIINYIIFHEVAHIIERKHNERFWRIVERRYPDHQRYENELFSYWFVVNDLISEASVHPANAFKRRTAQIEVKESSS